MAKKKDTSVEEVHVEQIEQEEVVNPRQERADQEASEFLGEEVKNGKVVEVEEENRVEKKAREIKENPKEEEKKVESPLLDGEKLKADIVAELDKRLPQNQTKEEKQEKKDAIAEYLEKAKAEGRNPTWEEALKFIAEEGSNRAYERIKAEQAQELQKVEEEKRLQEEQAEQQKVAQEEAQKEYNKVVDEDLDDLYKSGKLMRIRDKNNPNDPGLKQRQALFQKMYEVNTQRAQEGKRLIYSVKEVFYEHFSDPLKQPPGYDAPVSIGSGHSGSENPQEYSYLDIRGRDFRDIANNR